MLFFKKKSDPLYLALEEHTKQQLQKLPGEEELQKLTFSAAFEAKMQTLFARYRRHKAANRRALVALAACLALVVGVSAIPYPGQTLQTVSERNQKKVYAQIQEYNDTASGVFEYDYSKETPAYNFATSSMSSITPSLARVVADTQVGVYGRVTAKEYASVGYAGDKYQIDVSDTPVDLEEITHIRYTLWVYNTFIGSIGLKRTIYIYIIATAVAGAGTEGVAGKLKPGYNAVFLLERYKSPSGQILYSPYAQEHGSFMVENTKIYAFSNMQDFSGYDGKRVWILLRDIEKMRKKMGLDL